MHQLPTILSSVHYKLTDDDDDENYLNYPSDCQSVCGSVVLWSIQFSHILGELRYGSLGAGKFAEVCPMQVYVLGASVCLSAL